VIIRDGEPALAPPHPHATVSLIGRRAARLTSIGPVCWLMRIATRGWGTPPGGGGIKYVRLEAVGKSPPRLHKKFKKSCVEAALVGNVRFVAPRAGRSAVGHSTTSLVGSGKRRLNGRAMSRTIYEPVANYRAYVAAISAVDSVAVDPAHDLAGTAIYLVSRHLQRSAVLRI